MALFGGAGERIAYEIYDGPIGAPPLLLLHGFTASSASFFSNIPGLRERFHVIAVELLGHGASDAPANAARYGPGPAGERMAGLLDHLGIDSILICGHSLGGALALRFALDMPERVAGLVVINSNSAAGTPEWREDVRANMVAMAAKARAEGIGFLRDSRLNPAKGTRLPEEARLRLTSDFESLTAEGFAGTAEALVVDVNAFERLGELRCPVLVVIGDRDTDFVRNAPRFVVRLPHELVETVTIEGGGHAANLEQPDVFNAGVIEFAERIGYLERGKARHGGSARATSHVSSPPGPDETELEMALGPTLYADGMAWLREGRGRPLLGIVGTILILAGAALVVAAFFVGDGRDGEQPVIASGEATRTPTRVDQVAGVRTQGPETRTATPTAASPAAAATEPTQTPEAAATVELDPTPVSTPTPQPSLQPTPLPQPTPAPTPVAEPTPGPRLAINGPGAGLPGQTMTFSVSENPEALTRSWTSSNGAFAPHAPTFTVAFGAGCHSVSVTAIFPDGTTQTVTRGVVVGVVNCF